LGSLAAGFAIFDGQRRVVYQNEALRTLLELPHEADFTLLEKSLADIGLAHLYERSLQEKATADLPEVRRGGKSFRLFLAPVAMENTKTVLGAVMLLEDITEEKALERAKDDFLSIASHELRTPLTAIRANASMVRDAVEKTNDPDALAMVDDIHKASVRLIKIVHDFLEVAALERGVPVELTDGVDMQRVAQEAVEELMPLAKEKKLALSLPEGPAVIVRADVDRLKQVVTNLVGNALRYTKQGQVSVTLTKEDGKAVLRVTDTGAGVSREHQSLLFRKFQQADQGVMTREHSEGTGLGLYITRLIMESMGGTVDLEHSEAGKGSIFRATIPLSNA
jgi:signal transduction histidine kinase